MSDASASYDIGINLKKVGDGWDDLSAGVSSFTGLLDRAAGKLAALGSYAAFGAATAGVAALTYGVTHLNNEAEGAAISIGTIFSVNGIAANVPQGITMAADTIAKMRIDAQKLPGEFKDLQSIFTTAAIPMFQSGASVDQARRLSAQAMAAGAIMQLPMDMVAREFGMLLSGRAGAHNVFGTRLGFSGAKAKELNKDDPAARLKLIEAEMGKYSGAIDIFSHSYEGLSSTLVDNVKNFGRLATMPLFESVKTTLGEINDWFSANQTSVSNFATSLGHGIEQAFESGKAAIIEWYPIVENFVGVAWNRMKDFWGDVQPYVSSFASAMKEALSDPNGTIDKLVHLFEVYAAIKGGGVAYGLLGSAGGLASAAGGLFTGGAAKGAGAAVSAASGMAGMGGMGMTAVAEAAPRAATALGSLTLGATATGAVFLAAVAAWGFAVYEGVGLYQEMHSQTLANSQAIADAHGRDVTAMLKSADTQEQINLQIQDTAADYVTNMDATGWAMNDVATAAAYAAQGLNTFGQALLGSVEVTGNKRMDDIADKYAGDLMLALKANMHGGKGSWDAAASGLKPKPTMKGGHGGTSIQKVEIVVTSNQNPSRIALAVHAKLAGLSTNKRYSPDVPNYSAPDENG